MYKDNMDGLSVTIHFALVATLGIVVETRLQERQATHLAIPGPKQEHLLHPYLHLHCRNSLHLPQNPSHLIPTH